MASEKLNIVYYPMVRKNTTCTFQIFCDGERTAKMRKAIAMFLNISLSSTQQQTRPKPRSDKFSQGNAARPFLIQTVHYSHGQRRQRKRLAALFIQDNKEDDAKIKGAV